MSKTYHHVDLKPALIDAVLELLEDSGESSVSLRASARRVGVSQTAPYSHFENKGDLLASVAAAGFKRFASTMVSEATTDASATQKRLALGIGYVEFAVNNRGCFV
jgi:AcrR family transcriptional regulator